MPRMGLRASPCSLPPLRLSRSAAGACELAVAPAAAFVVLAVAHARLLNARDRARSAVAFYERGLQRVTAPVDRPRARRPRRAGSRASIAGESHPFAIDLDLFGRGSLFELLATTRTHAGEETLARWLLDPASPDVVRARQDAVRELAAQSRSARARRGHGRRACDVAVHAELLRRWSATPITPARHRRSVSCWRFSSRAPRTRSCGG